MTNAEKVKALSDRIPTEDRELLSDENLSAAIENAKYIIFEVRFPYHDYPSDVEPRYENLQIAIALEIINKMGAEGEVEHSENGIIRAYNSADISLDLISRITPKAGV